MVELLWHTEFLPVSVSSQPFVIVIKGNATPLAASIVSTEGISFNTTLHMFDKNICKGNFWKTRRLISSKYAPIPDDIFDNTSRYGGVLNTLHVRRVEDKDELEDRKKLYGNDFYKHVTTLKTPRLKDYYSAFNCKNSEYSMYAFRVFTENKSTANAKVTGSVNIIIQFDNNSSLVIPVKSFYITTAGWKKWPNFRLDAIHYLSRQNIEMATMIKNNENIENYMRKWRRPVFMEDFMFKSVQRLKRVVEEDEKGVKVKKRIYNRENDRVEPILKRPRNNGIVAYYVDTIGVNSIFGKVFPIALYFPFTVYGDVNVHSCIMHPIKMSPIFCGIGVPSQVYSGFEYEENDVFYGGQDIVKTMGNIVNREKEENGKQKLILTTVIDDIDLMNNVGVDKQYVSLNITLKYYTDKEMLQETTSQISIRVLLDHKADNDYKVAYSLLRYLNEQDATAFENDEDNFELQGFLTALKDSTENLNIESSSRSGYSGPDPNKYTVHGVNPFSAELEIPYDDLIDATDPFK